MSDAGLSLTPPRVPRISSSWLTLRLGREVGDDRVGEEGQADGVALLDRQVGQGGGQACRVVELRPPGVGAAHRGAGVHEQVKVQVGVGVVFLDVEPVVAGVELPVEVAEVVAGGILAVRGELDAHPEVGAPVQAVHRPRHDRAGAQLDRLQAGEEHGVDQFSGVEGHRGQASWRTVSIKRRTIASALTPSALAWKLSTSRWRRTGPAWAFTSSKST